MNSSNHIIELTNIKNNDLFEYSLIICKGEVKNGNNKNCLPSSFLTIKQHSSTRKVTINNTKKFKLLIDLEVGRNGLVLTYCCVSVNLNLEFKPRETIFSVIPLYVICAKHDGTFQAPTTVPNDPKNACNRIEIGCKLIQSLVAEKLYEGSFERKTFQLDFSNGLIFHSKLDFEKAYEMSETDLWYYIAREIMSSSIGNVNRKYLAFLSCTRYEGEKFVEGMEHCDIVKLTKGYVAYGGEALALLGTPCLYTWPETVEEIQNKFLDETEIDKFLFMDDSCYRGTLGGCFSTTLGATLHELSHTFDLGHSYDGIMGRGFDKIEDVFLENDCQSNRNPRIRIFDRPKITDNIFWTESCLAILNYHRWLNNYKIQLKSNITYDKNTKIVKSTAGLRVIELREDVNSVVIKHWVFVKKVLKFSHQITEEFWNIPNLLLFVEDGSGNILKTCL